MLRVRSGAVIPADLTRRTKKAEPLGSLFATNPSPTQQQAALSCYKQLAMMCSLRYGLRQGFADKRQETYSDDTRMSTPSQIRLQSGKDLIAV